MIRGLRRAARRRDLVRRIQRLEGQERYWVDVVERMDQEEQAGRNGFNEGRMERAVERRRHAEMRLELIVRMLRILDALLDNERFTSDVVDPMMSMPEVGAAGTGSEFEAILESMRTNQTFYNSNLRRALEQTDDYFKRLRDTTPMR